MTAARYRLFDCGSYPGLVIAESNGLAIEGEVYEVSEACLERLDEEEGVDIGLYERCRIQLKSPFDDIEIEAYFYLGDCRTLSDCGVRWTPRT